MTLKTQQNPQTKVKPEVVTRVDQEQLRWLFTAYYEDGTEITQTQEDKSVTGNGSAFTDVLDKNGLVNFELKHVNGQESVLVDLVNGAFLINGTPVNAHNQYFEPGKYALELVYFRESRIEPEIDTTGKTVSVHQYVNRYFLGWKTVVNGKDKQVTIAVG